MFQILIKLSQEYRVHLKLLVLILLFSINAFAQNSPVVVFEMKSERRSWLSDMHVVNKNVVLISGLFDKQMVFGGDTLRDKSFGSFVGRFENGVPQGARSVDGRLLGINDKFFCIVGHAKEFKRHTISKFDLKTNLLWEYSLELFDSARTRFHINDICFDEFDNTYVLCSILEGKGVLLINNDTIQGPTKFIVKINNEGKVIRHRELKVSFGNRLRIRGQKICAFSGEKTFYRSMVLDTDLRSEIKDDELNGLCKYTIWNKENFFRVEQTGTRPSRPYYLEKFNPNNKLVRRKMVFLDTVRFQSSIFQRELLDLNKEELAFVFVSRGRRIGDVYKFNLNILIIKKKDLSIARRIVYECDRLKLGTSGFDEHIPFRVYGEDILIGNDYTDYCRLGDLVIGDEKSTHGDPSFFIVRQPLK